MFKIELINFIRVRVTKIINELSNQQLNTIPNGLPHSIAWHLGHLCVTLGSKMYISNGLPTPAPTWIIDDFKPGTKAQKTYTDIELNEIKTLYSNMSVQLIADYNNGLFCNYTAWTTMAGEQIETFDDCIDFMHFHEGLHLGQIQYIKKLVTL
jgi:hypothetical protein